MDNFNQFVSRTESFLTLTSTPPILGAPAGLIKMALGTLQTITAIACAILVGIPTAAIKGNTSILDHSWTHIKHGIVNIATGALEAIPGFGLISYFIRLEDGKSTKLMPYDNVDLSKINKMLGTTEELEKKIRGEKLKTEAQVLEQFTKDYKRNIKMDVENKSIEKKDLNDTCSLFDFPELAAFGFDANMFEKGVLFCQQGNQTDALFLLDEKYKWITQKYLINPLPTEPGEMPKEEFFPNAKFSRNSEGKFLLEFKFTLFLFDIEKKRHTNRPPPEAKIEFKRKINLTDNTAPVVLEMTKYVRYVT